MYVASFIKCYKEKENKSSLRLKIVLNYIKNVV